MAVASKLPVFRRTNDQVDRDLDRREKAAESLDRLNLARAEYYESKTRISMIQEQEKLGSLIPIDQVALALEAVSSEVAAIIEGIPAKLRSAIKKLNDSDMRVIRETINSAMIRMSQVRLGESDGPERVREEVQDFEEE